MNSRLFNILFRVERILVSKITDKGADMKRTNPSGFLCGLCHPFLFVSFLLTGLAQITLSFRPLNPTNRSILMKKTSILFFTVILFAVTARAETLAGWNFWGNTLAQSTSVTANAAVQDASLAGIVALSRGAGITATTIPSTHTNTWHCRNRSASLASAITENSYITFTLTPEVNMAVTVTNFSWVGSYGTSQATGTLFSAAGGFSAGNQIGEAAMTSGSVTAPQENVIPVAPAVTFTNATEFRIYITGNDVTAPERFGDSDTDWGNTCLQVQGTAETTLPTGTMIFIR
jgi:hypothetical protein